MPKPKLDLVSDPQTTGMASSTGRPTTHNSGTPVDPPGGKFLGIKFECCGGIYARIYPNRKGDAYEGRCPKCMRAVRLGIGTGGTSARFFTAS